MLNRRSFFKVSGGSLLSLALLSGMRPNLFGAVAQERSDELNILCWEGYNTDDALSPFKKRNPGLVIRAESGTSDPDMINKLRAGESKVWDLINVNQPWARNQLYPENLIVPLDKERFAPYFDKMLPEFQGPFEWAMDASGKDLIGMAQRFGPFSFVVNTKKISRKLAEDQGYKLFLDPKMHKRYGVLTYDNWNISHMCMAADVDPYKKHTQEEIDRYAVVAKKIFDGAQMLTDNLVTMNLALINGEIDAYFTGGTYTSSPARYDGCDEVLAITPNSGPVDGKGGVVWIEITSMVNNPKLSPKAADFLEYVQEPDICKKVAFTEGTYNPVAQMGNPKVMAKFNKEELNAIQYDTLQEEMSRSVNYNINPDYDKMYEIYKAAKRS